MRLQVTIDHLPKQKLPINYQYLISSWIYKTLHNSDAEFSNWLHEKGYELNGKRYKHFCFSILQPKKYKIHTKENVFELVESPTKITISFNIEKAAKDLVKALFQNNLIELNSGEFFKFLGMVNQVSVEKPPVFENRMRFSAVTPICISVSDEESKYPQYLHPADKHYADAFALNLANKANAYLGEEKFSKEDVQFKLLSENSKKKKWTIKKTEIIGYLYDFEIIAPKELVEIGYYAGFGVQNSSLGMGFCIEKK